MPHYSLIQTLTTGKPARFSANGVRISREKYEWIGQMARMYGQYDSLSTRAWPMPCGGTKRKNYCFARWGV
jgi:hypothetical protein